MIHDDLPDGRLGDLVDSATAREMTGLPKASLAYYVGTGRLVPIARMNAGYVFSAKDVAAFKAHLPAVRRRRAQEGDARRRRA